MPADAPPEHISLLPAAVKTTALSRRVIDHRVAFLTAQLSGSAYTDYAWQEFDPMDLLDPDVSTSDTRNYAKRHHGQHRPTWGELSQSDFALLDLDPGIVLPPEMLQFRRARLALLVDDAWLKIKSASKTGHHPLQWAGYHEVCRQKGKTDRNFTEIATDDVAVAFRRKLVAMRCCCVPRPSIFQGAVVTSLIYSLSIHNTTQERLDTSLGETLGTQKGSGTQTTQDNVYYLLCDALDLKAGQAVAEGEGAGQMRAKRAHENQKPVAWAKLPSIMQQTWKMAAMCRRTGLFTAFTFNFGKTRLDKYRGKGKGNGADAWHKRATTMLRSLMPDELFSFAVERDLNGRWHIHGIVYGIHEEEFTERYSDALQRLGGNYSVGAELFQLDVQGGYGFNRMLGWIDYSTKSGNVWFESQSLTRHGKAMYEEICETWLDLSRQRSMAGRASAPVSGEC